MWQVSDLSEQNGVYKIALARTKGELIGKKQRMMVTPTIEPYEITPS